MRIGYDAKRIYHNTTGLGNYSRDLVRVLSTYYPSNTYWLYNPKPGKVTRLQADGKLVKEVLPQSFIAKKLHAIWRSKWMVKQLKKDKIEIYHGLTGELPIGIEKTNIKTVVTIHDLIFVRYPELYKAFDRKIYFKKFKHAAETADVVVAITEQTKEDIIDFLKIDPKKIQVIYQGCHNIFKEDIPADSQDDVFEKYSIPTDYILNVGSVNERKNVLSLVKAVAKTGDNLVIVGSGTEYYKKVTDYVVKMNLSNQIYFLSGLNMQEIATLYRNAKLFVYPSIFEGFGIPIIEALYSKTPVITTNGSCFPEAGGPSSYYLNDPYDITELEKAITHILSDKSLQETMIAKGYTFVQKFNDVVIANNWNTLYNRLSQ